MATITINTDLSIKVDIAGTLYVLEIDDVEKMPDFDLRDETPDEKWRVVFTLTNVDTESTIEYWERIAFDENAGKWIDNTENLYVSNLQENHDLWTEILGEKVPKPAAADRWGLIIAVLKVAIDKLNMMKQ